MHFKFGKLRTSLGFWTTKSLNVFFRINKHRLYSWVLYRLLLNMKLHLSSFDRAWLMADHMMTNTCSAILFSPSSIVSVSNINMEYYVVVWQRVDQMWTMFNQYVKTRTQDNFKFWIVSFCSVRTVIFVFVHRSFWHKFIVWLTLMLLASTWSSRYIDLDLLSAAPRCLNDSVLSIRVPSAWTEISWIPFSLFGLPKITKLQFEMLFVIYILLILQYFGGYARFNW